MKPLSVNVRLYGAFRPYGDRLAVTIAQGGCVRDVKKALGDKLPDVIAGLVADSAIANDETILTDDTVIEADDTLSVLPPVCGG